MPQNLKAFQKNDTGLIRLERKADHPDIQKMYCQAFGPGRFARTAYRIRERSAYNPALSCVAEHDGVLAGTIRFSEILIGESAAQALLLGPLVVKEEFRGYNYGVALMKHGLDLAQGAGFKLVILVGDLAYYQKAGFVRVPAKQIMLPAPYNAHRLLAYEIEAGILQKYHGCIQSV